jgi:hypothetical protein
MAPVVFPIPAELRALIASGAWPHDHREAGLQHSRPLVPADRVRAFAPEESSIYLLPPPFMSVRDLVEGAEWSFWESDMVAPDEISFEHTVVIGDFGIGSDAPIVLDYRPDARRPAVLRLRWGETRGDNHWVGVAADFARFAARLGLSPGDRRD